MLFVLPLIAHAKQGFDGKWLIELSVDPVTVGMLEIESTSKGWIGHVEGGPVGLQIKGKEILITVDSRDIAGFVFERKLTGKLTEGVLTGTVTVVDKPDSNENGKTWVATRYDPDAPALGKPRPNDLLGTWKPVQGLDFRKYSMDLTASAKEWHDGYLLHLDQPNVRCVSIGLAQLVTWSYPFEILQNGDRLTMLYELDSEVRRIFPKGHKPSEYFPNSAIGFSTGHWEGSTYVVVTNRLAQNVRDFRGEPISENAQIEERYSLSEDGNELSAVISLVDPENYKKSPIRRRLWKRDDDLEIFPYECDPMAFFRQLHDDGETELYFSRSYRAF